MQQEIDILILGKGGRESALARTIMQSPRCRHLYADIPFSGDNLTPVSLDVSDFPAIASFCNEHSIDLVVVGGAEPIVAGIRDFLSVQPGLEQLRVIAPTAEAARLEGSKEFAKEFMTENCIPSPRFMPVDEDTLDEGLSFLDSMRPPYVIKADGLANGIGVAIIENLAEAKDMLENMVLDGSRGEAGRRVLIEEFISGHECSVIVATDGEDYCLLPVAHDYKRLHDNDTGPNTPGMGAYAPDPMATPDFIAKVEKRIILPTLRALREQQIDYQGFLYFGIVNLDGEPVLLEYNVRLGDPEAQAILPLITSDFVELLEGITDRTVGLKRITTSGQCAVAVEVTTIDDCQYTASESIDIAHRFFDPEASTVILPDHMVWDMTGKLCSDGRRAVTVVSTGCDIASAAANDYQILEKIGNNAYYRKDIGA